MVLGPHAAFILAAYAIACAVVAGLIVWVVADHRAQQRRLAALEREGVTRRTTQEPGAERDGARSVMS